MSEVYRRHRERAGSGWGVWLLVIGIVGVIAVAVLVVFLVRGKSGGNLPGGLVVTPQGSLVDTGEMTEREFFEFLRSKGAKVNYGGNGFLFHEDDHPLAAKEFGYIGFCNHPNIESARRYAGDTATGFHWQRWSFVPMRGQSVRHGVAWEVRVALNLASDEELRAKNKEVEKSQQAKAANEKQQAADQKRLDDLNIESLTAFIRANALYRASRDGLSEEAERLMNKSIGLDAQANKITARHNWGQFGPNPPAKLGDLQTQKTKSILGEK